MGVNLEALFGRAAGEESVRPAVEEERQLDLEALFGGGGLPRRQRQPPSVVGFRAAPLLRARRRSSWTRRADGPAGSSPSSFVLATPGSCVGRTRGCR